MVDGKRWEEAPHQLPACADCHQPHRVRKVFYSQGMADRDCMSCHGKADLKAAKDGRSLFVDLAETQGSIHAEIACAKCHSQSSHERPCETITNKVDCASCHGDQVKQYLRGRHGQLFSENDPNAPTRMPR